MANKPAAAAKKPAVGKKPAAAAKRSPAKPAAARRRTPAKPVDAVVVPPVDATTAPPRPAPPVPSPAARDDHRSPVTDLAVTTIEATGDLMRIGMDVTRAVLRATLGRLPRP